MSRHMPQSDLDAAAEQISALSIPERIVVIADIMLRLQRAEASIARLEQRLEEDNR